MHNSMKIGLGVLAAALLAAATTATTPAVAGGGLAIGKAVDDVVEQFNRAANPPVPLPVPRPKLEYVPPERVPGGSTTWSDGAAGRTGPLESPVTTFGRNAGDKPASSSVTDGFNHAVRGNN